MFLEYWDGHDKDGYLVLKMVSPASGDRFVVPDTDLDQVFTIAEMVIEAEDVPGVFSG